MECGGCTACCYAFPVNDAGKAGFKKCKHEDGKCLIYENRPQVCKDYECAWLGQPTAPLELRPDKCGVIFTKLDDETMQVTLLRKPESIAVLQAYDFKKQGYKITHDST